MHSNIRAKHKFNEFRSVSADGDLLRHLGRTGAYRTFGATAMRLGPVSRAN